VIGAGPLRLRPGRVVSALHRGIAVVPTEATGERGASLAELLVVVSIVGVLSAVAGPPLAAAWRASALRAAAEDVRTMLALGRHLAIAHGTTVCVEAVGGGLRLWPGGLCGRGTAWTGPGTDASGLLRPADAAAVREGTRVVFTELGAAIPAGTFVVVDRARGDARSVVVAGSGRLSLR
jgi:prepilin-type N-terminal cleavage/methylation domain-containing protein